eukprot:scaffold7123_cov161-Skeletonema_marinoi.AAC.14
MELLVAVAECYDWLLLLDCSEYARTIVRLRESFCPGRLRSNSTEELISSFETLKECQALHTLASFYVGIEERMFGELLATLADEWRRHVNRSVGSRLLGLYCLEEWVVGSSSHSQERRLMG